MKLLLQIFLRTTLFLFSFWQCAAAVAQEKEDGKTTDTAVQSVTIDSVWYAHLWVWVTGATVFILIFIALLTASKKSDTITRKTIHAKKKDFGI